MIAAAGPQLVVLDLGRVLVRICAHWSDACRHAGVPLPTRDIDSAGLQAAVVAHETGQIDIDAFCNRVAPLVHLTPTQVRAVSDAWLQGAFPGARELVRDIARLPVRSACLSNTNDNHWRLMSTPAPGNANYVPLEELTWRFTSHRIGSMKPEARIYAQVEQAVGIAPERILFFDDDPDNIAAARARRWQTQQILPDTDPIAQVRARLRSCQLG